MGIECMQQCRAWLARTNPAERCAPCAEREREETALRMDGFHGWLQLRRSV